MGFTVGYLMFTKCDIRPYHNPENEARGGIYPSLGAMLVVLRISITSNRVRRCWISSGTYEPELSSAKVFDNNNTTVLPI
jgi:hypothetical protein